MLLLRKHAEQTQPRLNRRISQLQYMWPPAQWSHAKLSSIKDFRKNDWALSLLVYCTQTIEDHFVAMWRHVAFSLRIDRLRIPKVYCMTANLKSWPSSSRNLTLLGDTQYLSKLAQLYRIRMLEKYFCNLNFWGDKFWGRNCFTACHMYNCTYPRKVVPLPAWEGGGALTHKKRGPTSQVRKTTSTHWKERQTVIIKGGQKHIKRGANYMWEEGPTTDRKGGGTGTH